MLFRGMIANDTTLPISAIETLFGISKNLCNELTDWLCAMRGTFLVTGGRLGPLLVDAKDSKSVGGISFLLLCSLFVMVSCLCQYLWSGGGIRNGIKNIKQAAMVGTAPAT